MRVINQTKFGKSFMEIAKTINQTSKPVIAVNNDNNNVVIMGKDEYDGLKETLYLLSIPGMRQKLEEAVADPGEDFDGDLDKIV